MITLQLDWWLTRAITGDWETLPWMRECLGFNDTDTPTDSDCLGWGRGVDTELDPLGLNLAAISQLINFLCGGPPQTETDAKWVFPSVADSAVDRDRHSVVGWGASVLQWPWTESSVSAVEEILRGKRGKSVDANHLEFHSCPGVVEGLLHLHESTSSWRFIT